MPTPNKPNKPNYPPEVISSLSRWFHEAGFSPDSMVTWKPRFATEGKLLRWTKKTVQSYSRSEREYWPRFTVACSCDDPVGAVHAHTIMLWLPSNWEKLVLLARRQGLEPILTGQDGDTCRWDVGADKIDYVLRHLNVPGADWELTLPPKLREELRKTGQLWPISDLFS